jgi:hypothetical protein
MIRSEDYLKKMRIESRLRKVVKAIGLEKVSGPTILHTLFQGLTKRLKEDDWKVVVRHKGV